MADREYDDSTYIYDQGSLTYDGSMFFSKEFTETISVVDTDKLLCDSYGVENHNYNWRIQDHDIGVRELGQSFVGDGKVLNSVTVHLYQLGSPPPTGDITIRIYAHSGTFGTNSEPTGPILAESVGIEASGINDFPPELRTFTFSSSNKILLEEGEYYCVSIRFYHGDGSHYIGAGADQNGEHPGNIFWFSNQTLTWESISTYDLIFYLYTENVGTYFSKSATKNISDTITSTDSLKKSATKRLLETITSTDSLAKSATKILSESISIVDSKVFSVMKSVSETITITEKKIFSIARTFVDNITITDSKIVEILFDKPLSYIKSLPKNPNVKKMNVMLSSAKKTTISGTNRLKVKSKVLKNNIISKFK